jgi:hypothetical protein
MRLLSYYTTTEQANRKGGGVFEALKRGVFLGLGKDKEKLAGKMVN